MPENIKVLRRRIKAIKNTKKITRAMEMVAAAKLRRTQGVMNAARPFTRKLEQLLARLAGSPTVSENPLFEVRPEGSSPRLLVLFTSDRGLCGAFNSNLIRLAERTLKAEPATLLYCVGRKGRDYFRRRVGDRMIGSVVDLGGVVKGEVTEKIGSDLLEAFLSRKVRQIDLVYPRFISTATNKPAIDRYLPLTADAFGKQDAAKTGPPLEYILEPSPDRVFEAVLPRYLKSKVYLLLAETFTSEHSSRMLAMNGATKNCDDLTDSLSIRMNKARQAAITKEIAEIVGGAAALQG